MLSWPDFDIMSFGYSMNMYLCILGLTFFCSWAVFGTGLYITDHTSTVFNGNTVICSFPYKKFFNIYFVQEIKTNNEIGKTGLPKCS